MWKPVGLSTNMQQFPCI